MRVNFGDKTIADKTRRHFNAIAINIWGDREVTWTDGRVLQRKGARRAPQGPVHPHAAVPRRKRRRRAAPERLLPAAPVRRRARLRRRETRGQDGLCRVPRAPRARAGERQAPRPAVLPQAAARPRPLAPARAAPARRAVRAEALRGVRRAAPAGLREPRSARLDRHGSTSRGWSCSARSGWSHRRGKRSRRSSGDASSRVAYTPTLVFFDENGAEVIPGRGLPQAVPPRVRASTTSRAGPTATSRASSASSRGARRESAPEAVESSYGDEPLTAKEKQQLQFEPPRRQENQNL